MNGRIRRNFTLIELMAVMLLMGVLMAMMLPAFNRMIRGNKVDQMASNLKLGLEQAQSRAATTRKYVAVVLPNDQAIWSDDVTKPFCYGGYRFAYVESTATNTEWTFVSWVPQGEWKNAPDGAMLVYADSTLPAVGSGGGLTDALGSMTGTSGEFGTGLHSLVVPTTAKDMPTGTLDKCVVVFTPYGGLKNSTLYLAVAEALPAPSNKITYPVRESGANSDEKPTNFLRLKINQFTGRVEFITI